MVQRMTTEEALIDRRQIDNMLTFLKELKTNPYLVQKDMEKLKVPYRGNILTSLKKLKYIKYDSRAGVKTKKVLLIDPEPIHARKALEHVKATNNIKNKKNHIEKICLNCGSSIAKKNIYAKYCSEKCKMAYYRKNKKPNDNKFKKPTIAEISEYCRERGNSINPEKFYNYYESKGWVVGKSKMKDWKAAIRTWENNQKKYEPEMAQKEKNEKWHDLTCINCGNKFKTDNINHKFCSGNCLEQWNRVKLDPSKTYRLKQNLKGVILNNYKLQYRFLYVFWRDTGMTFKSVEDFKRKAEIADKQVIKL